MKQKKLPIEPHYHEARVFDFKKGILTITRKTCHKKVCNKPILVAKAAPDQWTPKLKQAGTARLFGPADTFSFRPNRKGVETMRKLETAEGTIRIGDYALALASPELTEAVMPEVVFDAHWRTWVDGKNVNGTPCPRTKSYHPCKCKTRRRSTK